MRAIVIGGGIGGPVAAAALRQAGLEAEVFEAAEGPAETEGLFLTIAVNGLRVLRQLDLLDPLLRADLIPTPTLEFISSNGKRLGAVSAGWLDGEVPSPTLMRGTLQKVLADQATGRGIEIHYGRRLVDYREKPDGVVARFADGSVVEGDLLVGADGIRSRVRAVMDPSAPAPSYTGLLNLGGIVRSSGLAPTPHTMRMMWGRFAFFGYTVRPDGEAWWFANASRDREPARGELDAISTDAWKAQLRELFGRDAAFVLELIEATPHIGAFPIHDMPSLSTWHSKRVVLLGDAAHAVSPSAGQGASMALEDALMLAHALRRHGRIDDALAAYEAARRPRAERVVASGRRRGAYKAPKSWLALKTRDLIMPAALRLFAREGAMSWVHDYRIDWAGPGELAPAAASSTTSTRFHPRTELTR
ncbi:MAG TPA: FAD-dependent monooxygenase [Longimicrobiaceae bacterium]